MYCLPQNFWNAVWLDAALVAGIAGHNLLATEICGVQVASHLDHFSGSELGLLVVAFIGGGVAVLAGDSERAGDKPHSVS